MDLGRDMETLPLASEMEAHDLEGFDSSFREATSSARDPWASSITSQMFGRFGRTKAAVAVGSALAIFGIMGLATASSGHIAAQAAKAVIKSRPGFTMLTGSADPKPAAKPAAAPGRNSTPFTPGVSMSTGVAITNYGKDCWDACQNSGFCQEFCGAGNACCRYLEGTDPPECHGVFDFGSKSYHTCVAPVNPTFFVVLEEPAVEHWGVDCLASCGNAGYCQEFCGMGNACCKFGASTDPAECNGISQWGSKDRHTCVAPVRPEYVTAKRPSNSTIKNWGQDCYSDCGGSGLCQEFCGLGNACCRFKSEVDPAECHGVTEFGSKDRHTCVIPVNPYFKAQAEKTPTVLHWGEDCLAGCGDAGYCQEFCGLGNACCKWGESIKPECQGITEYGSKDRHTCVAPVSSAYVVEKVPVEPLSSAADVTNWGMDCWTSCDGAGYCPSFCGMGNACCRFGSSMDPAECHGITQFGAKDRHTCVTPVNPVWWVKANSTVKNWGADCYAACNEIGGVCPDFCGAGNACCRFGSGLDPPECHGIEHWGAKDIHTCVRPVNALFVNHLAEDCWSHCDGAGMCEDWCGAGNACCKFYQGDDPDECKGVTYWPVHTHHTCVKAAPSHHGVPPALNPEECIPGQVKSAAGKCRPSQNTTIMTFYMYRATNDKWGAHLENANLGNVEGVLWYLHESVVNQCPRKENINRILRYVVTMRNPYTLFEGGRHFQFGQYTDFQHGQCKFNQSNCTGLWEKYGYAVGCTPLDVLGADLPNYAGPPQPVWYSLPGRCPSQQMDSEGDKPFGCWTDEPGGMCMYPDGTKNCTWRAEYAGEIRVDELSGITDPANFCSQGNKEYDTETDQGVGVNFWNNRRDPEQCKRRADYVRELFEMKYPNYPDNLGEPQCDWWGGKQR